MSDILKSKKNAILAESAALALERHPGCNIKRCESPIEELLFTALWSRGDWRRLLYASAFDDVATAARYAGLEPGMPIMSPQVRVGDYRADFLVSVVPYEGDKPIHFVIECDGHDFHERTKEQAARDKLRDREMLAGGFNVIRFTGAEIWANPGDCADQVLEIVYATMVARAVA
jgi:very-short-patch-repair endonuclease